MRTLKWVTLFLLFSLLVMVGAGIAGAAPPEPKEPIWYNSDQSDEIPRKFDEHVVALWNEAHPDQPVIHSILDHEDFKTALRAYLVAEPGPDVLTWYSGNRMRWFAGMGLLADLTGLWKEQGWDKAYPPSVHAAAKYGDKYYFVPSGYYAWGVFYKPSVFKAAGIESVPKTWDELLTACDKCRAIGKIPIAIGTRMRWTAAGWFDYLNMRTNGPEFHMRLMELQESYTDPRVYKVFEHWKELFDHKCFIENPSAYMWQEAVIPLNKGEAAMYLMGDFLRDIMPPEAQEDLDIFRFPIIDPNVKIGEDAPTDGHMIPAKAHNLEGAKAFLAHYGSAETQALMFKERGFLPTRSDVDLSAANRFQKRNIEILQGADLIMQFYDRDSPEPMADAGMDAIMAFWENPGNIDKILKDLEAERVRIKEELGKEMKGGE